MKEFPENIGYFEIPHPADISVAVTGDSLSSLFTESLKAMGDIAGVRILDQGSQPDHFMIQGISCEIILVSFLNEMNFILENGYWPTNINLEINGEYLNCSFDKNKCISEGYEIKAVTYSEIRIFRRNLYWHTKIVFDV